MFDTASLPLGYIWLAAGAFLLALEAFGAPGMGLAFGGLAALIVGAVLEFGVMPGMGLALQFGLWVVLTALFALLLWKPLKTWRSPPVADGGYQNIVGDLATVEGEDLVRGQIGEARWSGTIMQAEIDPMADALRIAAGEIAEIVHVRGTTLFLRPRGSRRQEEII